MAEDIEVQEFFNRGAKLVPNVIGGALGAAIGLTGGPAGAIIGGIVGPYFAGTLERLTSEYITRSLGVRQKDRAAAGILLMQEAVRLRLDNGESLNSDQWETRENGRSSVDEVAEQAIQLMISSVDERRLPFMANFYASVYFSRDFRSDQAQAIGRKLETLSFQNMCVVHLVANGSLYSGHSRPTESARQWPIKDRVLANDIFDLKGIFVQVVAGEESAIALLGFDEVDPGIMRLSALGNLLHDMMGLNGISANDSTLVATRESLENISLYPLEDPDLVEAFSLGTINGGIF